MRRSRRLLSISVATALSAGPAVMLAAPPAAAAASAPTIALTDGTNIVRVLASAPAVAVTPAAPITGLAGGETILGLDVRPATGVLYGLGSTSRLYTIDPATAVATAVGPAFASPPLNGTQFGMDFNPVVDRIRITSNTSQNIRLNPTTGDVVVADTPLNGGASDAEGVAYTNNISPAASTTLYDISTAADSLFIQNPPNNGTLTLVGPLGVDVTDASFDIGPGDAPQPAYAVLQSAADSIYRLYTVNLGTGAVTLVGATPAGYNSMAILPGGFVRFSASTYTVAEDVGSATITVQRIGGSAGRIEVDVLAAPGTATDPADFTGSTTTVAFEDGETSKTVFVPIVDDPDAESDETIALSLNNPQGVGTNTVPPSLATLTIAANDETVQVLPVATSAEEGNLLVLNVTRAGDIAAPLSVDYTITDVSTVAAFDYTGTGGTVLFAAGVADAVINIPITNDANPEPDETFVVTLSNPSLGTVTGPGSTVTIPANDPEAPAPPAPPAPTASATPTPTVSPTPSASPTASATGCSTGAAAAASLAADVTQITAGNSPALTGTVRNAAGQPCAGASIAILKKSYGEAAYSTLATVTTDAAGAFRLVVRPLTQTAYGANTPTGSVRSNVVVIRVYNRVNLVLPALPAPVGSARAVSNPVTFSGNLLPAYANVAVGLGTFVDGRFVVLDQTMTNGSGAFTLTRTVRTGTNVFVLFTSAHQGTDKGAKSITLAVS